MSDGLTIHDLLAKVMADIGAVAKRDHNSQQGFNFRGIDSVVNAVGPVLRTHGVMMLPEAGAPTVDHYQSKNGAQMTHVLLPVTFRFYGPAGDSVSCSVIGEAADAGDKVMSKAHSVAWRIALLECFAIPTDEPDPDAASHERAPEPAPAPEIDWDALGWTGQADYDEAFGKARNDTLNLLPDETQEEMRAWLKEQGWTLPYTPEQIKAWVDEIELRRPF